MKRPKSIIGLLAILVAGVLPATVGTCNRTPYGGTFDLVSSNDHLVSDVLDIVFGEDDD